MSTHKNIDRICVAVTLVSLLITLLFMNGSRLGLAAVADLDAERHAGDTDFTENDLDGTWYLSEALQGFSWMGGTTGMTEIVLEGESASVSGKGAYVNDGNVYITGAGHYRISGSLADGSIIVDAYRSSKIWLLLDGADIYCSDNAGIWVKQADKVFLTLAEGTENSVHCGSEYSEEALADGAGGAVFTHDDMTINGGGSLSITAEYKHGIDANDELVITGGTIEISCPQDGMHVNDAVKLSGADITVNAGDDGIHSDTSILVKDGTIRIPSCYEGMEAPTVEIRGGDIEIYPEDDGVNANGGSGGMGFGGPPGGGNMGGGFRSMGEGFGGGTQPADNSASQPADNSTSQSKNNSADSSSASSEESESWIRISGGSITIINEDARDADGLDSNGDIYITGGVIRVSLNGSGSNNAIDYGSESGGRCLINGGNVIACGSYSMAESFDSDSEQCSILYTRSDAAEAGTVLSLADSDGNVLLTYEVPCSFTAATISCPEMEIGKTYSILVGDEAEEVTISEVSSSFGDVQSGGFGGMHFGRGGGRGDFGRHGQRGSWNGSVVNESGTQSAGSSAQSSGSNRQGAGADKEAAQGRESAAESLPTKGEASDGTGETMGMSDGMLVEAQDGKPVGTAEETSDGKPVGTAEETSNGKPVGTAGETSDGMPAAREGEVSDAMSYGPPAPPDWDNASASDMEMSFPMEGAGPGGGFPGGQPGDGQRMGGGPGMGQPGMGAEGIGNAGSVSGQSNFAANLTSLSDISPEIWLRLLASVLCLAGGLIFAIYWRRER